MWIGKRDLYRCYRDCTLLLFLLYGLLLCLHHQVKLDDKVEISQKDIGVRAKMSVSSSKVRNLNRACCPKSRRSQVEICIDE